MTQHRIKRTDQEWLDLIRNCYSSGLKVGTWRVRHDITVKVFYYHAQ